MATIITEQDVVDRLGRGDAADAGLTIVIGVATDIIRAFTEQTITRVGNEQITLDGSGGDVLLLPERPVMSVRTVTVDGTDLTQGDDYTWDANGLLYRVDSIWTEDRQNVTVTYDHGWADGTIPRDLTGVALELACRLFVQGPAVSETLGQASVRYAGPASDLTTTERYVLAKYRQTR